MGQHFTNPSDERLRRILSEAKTIAVVGISEKPDRPSHEVAKYLQQQGYRIVPINPALEQVLGEQAFPSVASVPTDVIIDIIDVFRRSEAVPEIAEEAVGNGASCLWLQEGVVSLEGQEVASSAGLNVVMDRCIKKEHQRLMT